MSLSIITPHFNDFEGLKQIYGCLKKQTNRAWEWVIVDDCSHSALLLEIKEWKNNIEDARIVFFENSIKSNASVCRNKGLEVATSNHLIFLDSDDFIAENFVANRDILFEEFAVFPNFNVVNEEGQIIKRYLKEQNNLLERFLSAQFLWQTSCILWDKAFLIQIGKFDINLQRLQDVELSIRALFAGKKYKLFDNDVDFFYRTKPISAKADIVKKSCNSVNYLIFKLQNSFNLDSYRQSLIKSYYFACVKVLHRCQNKKDVVFVKSSLAQFYKLKYINVYEYMVGFNLLILYQNHLISDSLFIKINRYFFK